MAERLMPKVYMIGDSNTQISIDGGFSAKLASEYIRRCDVINRGYSGYTSNDLRIMLAKMLVNDNQPSGAIHTATILLGSNDAVGPKELDNRHVPLDVYKKNMEYIISLLKGNDVKNIILLSPPPCDDKVWAECLMQAKGVSSALRNSNVAKYADICVKVASDENIGLIDLYGEMMALENWESYLADGLHLNAKGNLFVFYKLKEILDKIIPIQSVYPDWKDIDQNFPESSLS